MSKIILLLFASIEILTVHPGMIRHKLSVSHMPTSGRFSHNDQVGGQSTDQFFFFFQK